MKQRNISWLRALWWLTLLLAIAILVASLPGYGIRVQPPSPSAEFAPLVQLGKWLGVIFSISAALTSLGLACLLFWKKADEPMALFLSFYLLNYGVLLSGPLEAFFEYWFPHATQLPLLLQGVLFGGLSFVLVLIFPNGQFVPRWTRFVIPLAGALFVLAYLVLDAEEAIKVNTPRSQILNGILFLLFALSLANQVYRYRKTYTHVERQQTKWVVYGMALFIALILLVSIPYYYRLNQPSDWVEPWWTPFVSTSWWLTLNILPISFTLAIMRSRLWDIDLLIRRTLIYAAMTAALALVYFGSVVLLQQLFRALTGQSSELAIIISTLAIAALFNPLRRRVQDAIDRAFYRRKYDAAKVLAEFAATARDEVELEKLTARLIEVVQETMQPASVGLWLKKGEKRQ